MSVYFRTANDLITKIGGHLAQLQQEREAQRPLQSGETLTPEQTAYFNAVLDYVRECRPLLNQGQYQLLEPPRLADFDVDLKSFRGVDKLSAIK